MKTLRLLLFEIAFISTMNSLKSMNQINDDNIKANKTLCIGADIGSLRMIKEALQKGANVNSEERSWTALKFAIAKKHMKIIEFLIYETNADVNIGGGYMNLATPLQIAIDNLPEIIPLLIDNGALINEKIAKRLKKTMFATIFKNYNIKVRLQVNEELDPMLPPVLSNIVGDYLEILP